MEQDPRPTERCTVGQDPWHRQNTGHCGAGSLPVGPGQRAMGQNPTPQGLGTPAPPREPQYGAEPATPQVPWGSGRAALPVGSACRRGSRQETWGTPWWDTRVHSPPAPPGTHQPPSSLWGGRCGRASVSPQGLWGTAQMLLAEPGFGASCFRIPRGDSGSLLPHHHDAKAPRPGCREGDAVESRSASPTPVTASTQLNVPVTAPWGTPGLTPPPSASPHPPAPRTAGAGSPGTAPWSPRPGGRSRLCQIRDPPAPPCRARHAPTSPTRPRQLPALPTTAKTAAQARGGTGRTQCHRHLPWGDSEVGQPWGGHGAGVITPQR